MKVAVTGGSGQLGSLVLERLLARRDVSEVLSIDRRPPRVQAPRLRALEHDVRAPGLERALEGTDVVIHLAFVVTKRLSDAELDAINVRGSENVFRAAIAAGARQVIYASSIAAYGFTPRREPLVEETPRIRDRKLAYARCKFDVEALLDELEREHPEVAWARLRPSILVGARMPHALGELLRRGFLPDTGRAPLPIVWDEDVADAFIAVLDRRARGAWNLSADACAPASRLARETPFRVLRAPHEAVVQFVRLARWLGDLADPAWIETSRRAFTVSSEKAVRELAWKRSCPTAVDVLLKLHEEKSHRGHREHRERRTAPSL